MTTFKVTSEANGQTITVTAHINGNDGNLIIADQRETLITLNIRRLPALASALQQIQELVAVAQAEGILSNVQREGGIQDDDNSGS